MALTDWTQQANPGAQAATQQQAYAGSYSYYLDGANSAPLITLDKSATDSPAEGKVKTRFYIPGGNSPKMNVVARYVDADNHYAIQLDTPNTQIRLQDKSTGSFSEVDAASISSNPTTDTWHQLEALWWENAGVFNARLKVDGTQLGSDLSHAGNSHATGGAIGLLEFNDLIYYDETEVFY